MNKEKQQESQLSTADRARDQAPQQIEDSLLSQFHFGFEVPTNFILDLFQQIAAQSNFQMIQKQANHATAIKQIKKTFLQMLDCFNWVSQGNMTAIKLTIQTNQKTSKRICRIRGLLGSKRQVKGFIKHFKSKSSQLIKVQNAFYPQQQAQDIENNLQNPFHLQACAIYMFHKILSNDQYGIGSILKTSLSNWKNKYNNVQASSKLLPSPMKNLMSIIQQIIQNLYKDFNYGKKQMEKVMPYCRVSVQKYIFNQVQNILTPIYHFSTSEMDNIFQQKRKKIFATKSLFGILEEIGLHKQLWFIKDDKVIHEIKPLKQWKSIVKYTDISLQLEKLPHSKTPRQKMKQCQLAYTMLKTFYYQHTNKKKQLTNIQQIIPILIVIILFTEVTSLKGELQIILDFIEADPCEMEAQKRLMINMVESCNFIWRDWKV